MPGKAIEIDCSQLEAFIKQVDAAGNGVLKEELKKYLQALGTEFLRVVEDEIIRRNVVDTRLLLNSFHKGSGDNLWLLSEGGLTLEIGTNVKYASYAIDAVITTNAVINCIIILPGCSPFETPNAAKTVTAINPNTIRIVISTILFAL